MRVRIQLKIQYFESEKDKLQEALWNLEEREKAIDQ